jgi:hypothetical protein
MYYGVLHRPNLILAGSTRDDEQVLYANCSVEEGKLQDSYSHHSDGLRTEWMNASTRGDNSTTQLRKEYIDSHKQSRPDSRQFFGKRSLKG